jgi:tetratricopeptide (TPR) repeat protein
MAFPFARLAIRRVWKTKKVAQKRIEGRSPLLHGKAARWAAFVMAACPLSASAVPPATDVHCGVDVEVAIPAGINTVLAVRDDTSAFLEIGERGRDLAWRTGDAGDFTPVSPRPPRWGKMLVRVAVEDRVQIRLDDRNSEPGAAHVRLHCGQDAGVEQLAQCLDGVARGWPGWSSLARQWRAPEGTCTAFHLHEAAARASERGDYAAAITLYSRAAEVWERLGQPARAAAATLGLSERLADAGHYDAALDAAIRAAAMAREAAAPYYALRAESARCLMLDDMGRLAEAAACLRPVPDAFAALGEIVEAANTWNNLAAFDLDRGDPAAARRDIERARAYADRLPPRIHARLHLSVSRVAAAEGRFPDALAALQASFDAVEQVDDTRGRANVLLQAARQYQRIAAPLEARAMALQALDLYTRLGAPERIAAATTVLARLDFDEGDLASAVEAAEAAAVLYAQGGLRLEELAAWLLAARAGDERAWSVIDRLLAEGDPGSPWQSIQIELARGEQAVLVAGPAESASLAARMDALSGQVQDIQQWLDIQRLRARALLRAGRADDARAGLEVALARHRKLVQAARMPSLRQMLLRQSRSLVATWIDALLALPEGDRPEPGAIRGRLRWMYGMHLLQPRGDDVRKADAELDRQLTGLLRTGDAGDPTSRMRAQHSLLYLFASAGTSDLPAESLPRLRSPEPAPAGVARLTFGVGEQGALAIVEREGQLKLLTLASPSDLAARVRTLAGLVQKRDASAAEVHRVAAELSADLLPPALGAPPSQLWIDWDPHLATVPFALLPWPGRDWPMVEDIAVSRRLGDERAPLQRPDGIDLLVAAAPAGSGSEDLPWLAGAEREPGLVAAAFPQAPVRTHGGRTGGRAQLQALLGRAGTWLHVAAHGVSRSGIQGLAGLWLEPEGEGGAPQFVSWLGLADTPLAADLVVLNACQLADSDAAVSAAIGFATALAAAGVDHVVAANWQLSDSASAVWVPAFYRALAEENGTPVTALRQAQLALRRSRAFRHPFYWAGLGHLQGMD